MTDNTHQAPGSAAPAATQDSAAARAAHGVAAADRSPASASAPVASAAAIANTPADLRDRALRGALLARADLWNAAAERARRLMTSRAKDITDATRMVDDYRQHAHDLARARRLMPDSRAREFLETAYAQAHTTLHKPATHIGYALWSLFRDQIPEAIRWLRPHIAWVSLLFVTSIFVGGWMVHTYPELINLFASPALIATVERGELWTEGMLNVVPSSVLSVQILTNNIIVSLFAYCAGFLFGLGTFYIVGLNGMMLGAIFMFCRQHGLDDELLQFIVAHGCVELSVMVLSGAAGAAVGEALIRPTTARRSQSFQIAAIRTSKVLTACVVLLIGCGFIEGYISPDPDFPVWARVIVGVSYWLFMVSLLRGYPLGRSRSDTPIEAYAGYTRRERLRNSYSANTACSSNSSLVAITGAPSFLSNSRCAVARISCSCAASAIQGSRQPTASRCASAAISALCTPATTTRCGGDSNRTLRASCSATAASSRSVSNITSVRCFSTERMRTAAATGSDSAASTFNRSSVRRMRVIAAAPRSGAHTASVRSENTTRPARSSFGVTTSASRAAMFEYRPNRSSLPARTRLSRPASIATSTSRCWSSVNSRVTKRRVRAVAFQSMREIGSPGTYSRS